MAPFLEHIPSSSSKVKEFQSSEGKGKSADHIAAQTKSNTDPATHWGGGEFMIEKKEKYSKWLE